MIHKISEGNYLTSSYQSWRPGAYADEKTAKYSFRFNDEDLKKLQESVNPGGIITYEMLKNLKKEKNEK